MGNPLDDGVLLGPLHSQQAVKLYEEAIEEIKRLGGRIEHGGKVGNEYIQQLQCTVKLWCTIVDTSNLQLLFQLDCYPMHRW